MAEANFNEMGNISEEKMKSFLEYEEKQKKEAERKERLEKFLNPEDPKRKEFNNMVWEKGGLKDVYESKPEIFDDPGRFADNFEFAVSKYEALHKSSQMQSESMEKGSDVESDTEKKGYETQEKGEQGKVFQQSGNAGHEKTGRFSFKDIPLKDLIEKGMPNGEKLPPHLAVMAKIFN